MNDVERLAKAATELGNHVAAFVRMSNGIARLLTDGERPDLDPATVRAIARAVKDEHDGFRREHLRGMIDSLNEVVATSDAMYQAEPTAPEPAPEPAPALAEPGKAVLGDVTVPSEAPNGERPPAA